MRRLRWPHVSLLIAFVLALGWVVSTWFFLLEAWGARNEEKSGRFVFWAVTTWCGLPLLFTLCTIVGAIGVARARR